MQRVIINVNDESKMEVLVNFLKSLDYISLESIDTIELSGLQKGILDHRRENIAEEEFIPWEIAKNNLRKK